MVHHPRVTKPPRRGAAFRNVGLSALALAAVTFVAAARALPTQAPRIEVGDTAPDIELKTPEGKAYRLSEIRGKQAVVLVFIRGVW